MQWTQKIRNLSRSFSTHPIRDRTSSRIPTFCSRATANVHLLARQTRSLWYPWIWISKQTKQTKQTLAKSNMKNLFARQARLKHLHMTTTSSFLQSLMNLDSSLLKSTTGSRKPWLTLRWYLTRNSSCLKPMLLRRKKIKKSIMNSECLELKADQTFCFTKRSAKRLLKNFVLCFRATCKVSVFPTSRTPWAKRKISMSKKLEPKHSWNSRCIKTLMKNCKCSSSPTKTRCLR